MNKKSPNQNHCQINYVYGSWQKKFCKWIDFGHKDATDELKFGWFEFGELHTIRQIYLTLLLPNIPAIQYIVVQ